METTIKYIGGYIVYWGYIGIMEKKMETTIYDIGGYIVDWEYWDNGKENSNYYSILRVI